MYTLGISLALLVLLSHGPHHMCSRQQCVRTLSPEVHLAREAGCEHGVPLQRFPWLCHRLHPHRPR